MHLILTFIELHVCGDIVFKLHETTFNYYIQCNYIESPKWTLSTCTCLYSATSLCSRNVLQWASLHPQNIFSDEAFICCFFVQVTSRSISSTSQFWMDMTVFLLMRLRIVLLVKLSLFTCYRLGNYNSSDTLTINLTHRRSVRSFFFCGR